MKKMYYAEYCEYGTNVSYESFGGGAYLFYAFDSKATRDEWVEANEWDGSNLVAAATTRKNVEHCCGKDFSLVKVEEGRYLCCRKGTEYEAEMELADRW